MLTNCFLRLLVVKCLYITLSTVPVEGGGELCSLALHDNTVDIGGGNCTCAPGYYRLYDTVSGTLSLTERSKWWCEPCKTGFFKSINGLFPCLPCESDYTWSAVGQAECAQCSETSMLTAETRHTRCLPCPTSIMTLLSYIDLKHIRNVPVRAQEGHTLLLNSNNVAHFVQLFFIDETACRLPAMLQDVSSILLPRTICPLGTQIEPLGAQLQTANQDLDTQCQNCAVGKYSDETSTLICKTVSICPDARFRDTTGIAYNTIARKINSNCKLDWLQSMISAGRHPYVAAGQSFKFNDHRHSPILGYSMCATANNVKCMVLGVQRCQFDFLDSWKTGLVPLNNQQSTPCQYHCADGYYVRI